MRSLYESLLDDEEDMINDESAAGMVLLDKLNTDKEFLEKYFEVFTLYSGLSKMPLDEFGKTHGIIDYDDKSKTLVFNKVGFTRFGITRNVKKLSDIIPLKFDNILFDGTKAYNNYRNEVKIDLEDINSNTLAKLVICNNMKLYMNRAQNISNITFTIITENIPAAISLDGWDIKLNNVNIALKCKKPSPTQGHNTRLNIFSWGELPNLSGVNCNTEYLRIYNPGIFDEKSVSDKLSKILDINTPINIYDLKLEKEVSKKLNIKKLVAAFNNKKRYQFVDDFCHLADNANLTLVLGLLHFKDLNTIEISNNNIQMVFTKDIKLFSLLKGYMRPHFKTPNNINIPQTKDGWYITINKD